MLMELRIWVPGLAFYAAGAIAPLLIVVLLAQ
jgi:hypothetical protein